MQQASLTLGQKIKNFRKRAGMSQLDLETAIGTSAGSISRIEGGKVAPTRETLYKIIDILRLGSREAAYLFDLQHNDPSATEVEQAKQSVEETLRDPQVLTYLLDQNSRVIEISQGFRNLAESIMINPDNLLGRHVLEVLFDPSLGVRQAIEPDKFEDLATTTLAVINQERSYLLAEPWWKDLLNHLAQFDGFSSAWSRAQSSQVDLYHPKARSVFFNVGGIQIPMVFHINTLATDPRFSLLEYRPA